MASIKAKIGPQTMMGLQPGQIIWDTDLRRFGARWGARAPTYFIAPRVDGKQRWITLGRHGVLTPAEARAKAREMLALADLGEDPTRAREARRKIPLFSEYSDSWLRTHVKAKRKGATHEEYRRIIDLHLKPALGKIRVDRLERSDALDVQARLAETPYQANRAIAVLSAMMTHAEGLKFRGQFTNPCRGIERFKEQKRKRPLSPAELARLWRHLQSLDATHNPFIVGALRLLLLTGMRREEVLTLKKAWVFRDEMELRLPDSKTGPRTIVLSGAAMQVITALPAFADNEFVFAGLKRGQRLVNISDTWQEIRAALGFPDVRLHDLRHTVGSMLAKSAPLIVVRDALGHQEISTTNGYSHAAADDVRAAMESHSRFTQVR